MHLASLESSALLIGVLALFFFFHSMYRQLKHSHLPTVVNMSLLDILLKHSELSLVSDGVVQPFKESLTIDNFIWI